MALEIIQTGSSLQRLDEDGNLLSLTLPPGVTIDAQTPPRWEAFNERLVLVSSPSRPLTIDPDGTVRPLTPLPPATAPVLSGVTTGTLTGTYRARHTNRIIDDEGNVIAESDYGPQATAVTITSKKLRASSIEISPDTISDRPVYRTTTNGAVYFGWTLADGNVITTVEDDLSDEGLQTIEAARLGSPPRLVTIGKFRGRLFGTGDVAPDTIRYTEAGRGYAWPSDNEINAPDRGADDFGIVGLAPRKDSLGYGRRNMIGHIVGTGREDTDGLVDLDPVTVATHVGFLSQESVKVFRDKCYFLWLDGVYRWDSEGVRCVSDGGGRNGSGKVRSWFATDDFFNRAMFPYAFASIDPSGPSYRLFLCSADSTTTDRWVEYDINADTWWGPHETDLFTPTAAFERTTADGLLVSVIGSATTVYGDQATRTDGPSTAISASAISKRHDLGDPDREKFFGQISLFGKAQPSGTLLVRQRVGGLGTTTASTSDADLTLTRQRLARIGHGKHAQLEFINADVGIDAEIYGYVIDPARVLGRR